MRGSGLASLVRWDSVRGKLGVPEDPGEVLWRGYAMEGFAAQHMWILRGGRVVRGCVCRAEQRWREKLREVVTAQACESSTGEGIGENLVLHEVTRG